MNQESKPQPGKDAPEQKPEAASADLAVDEFFTQLQSEMRRPDLSQEAIASAFQAIQKLALDSGVDEAVQPSAARSATGADVCPSCNAPVRGAGRFCSACGVPLQAPAGQSAYGPANTPMQAGEHHYHHHYHHHYFPAAHGVAPAGAPDQRVPATAAQREAGRPRGHSGGTSFSRAEAAVRRMTQDWAQACNTKQLDDLVELYSNDALVLRANFPPIRGTSAVREFFVAALDSGLGDAEFEPLRVEIFGDVAFEAGRYKTLAPIAVGKRREERGKYLIVFARQAAGDWKAMVDCWSSDLGLGVESPLKPGAQVAATPLPRSARKI